MVARLDPAKPLKRGVHFFREWTRMRVTQGLYISGWDNFKFSFLNFAVWLHVVLKYAEGQKPAGVTLMTFQFETVDLADH
jgi:hypothetical protein